MKGFSRNRNGVVVAIFSEDRINYFKEECGCFARSFLGVFPICFY
jgi:hypothetical protein